MRPAWQALLLFVLATGPGCRSAPATDLPGLAERPPLPCSVLVSGGAFVEPPRGMRDAGPRARTFADDGGEAFALETLAQVLRRGRVFVRAGADGQDSARRRHIAAASDARALADLLQAARDAGHDHVLIVERVDDGPIEALGINGQWPITLTTWLLVGLGAVIPDHAYESRAALRASLRDAHDGHVVQELVVGASTVELSLLERTGFWGWVQSLIVPPFWVGDDEARVVAQVRPVVQQRLSIGLAQRLKSVDVADRVTRDQPASVQVERTSGGLAFVVLAQETISFLRVRVDDEAVAGLAFEAFHRELLASHTPADAALRYAAVLPLPAHGKRMQVLVQTISGRVGSLSLDLGALR
jgi:hypothetical protein